MKKRDRWLQRQAERKLDPPVPAPASADAGDGKSSWDRVGWVVAGVLVAALVASVAYKIWPASDADDSVPIAGTKMTPTPEPEDPHVPSVEPHGHMVHPAMHRRGDGYIYSSNGADPTPA